MRASISHGPVLTAEQAIAEITAQGLHPVVLEVPATENDFHWHDFDSVTYVLEGSLEVTVQATGEVYTLVPGDRSEAKAGFVHREKHSGFKAAFGFWVDPATLSLPIEKPLPAPA